MSSRPRNWLADANVATELWRGPAVLGLSAALVLWLVWYFTKAPCTMENARAGLCNDAPIARYIDHQILGQCILLGIAVMALRGGYNEIMVSRERKRADLEKQRADAAQEKLNQERELMAEKMAEMLAERERLISEQQEADLRAHWEELEAQARAEREQREADLRAHWEELEAQARAERELDRAERQAMLNTMVQISNTLAQLVANQHNGQSPPQD